LTSILLLPWPSGWVERRLCQEDGDITWRSSASDPHLVTVGEATANDVKMREEL